MDDDLLPKSRTREEYQLGLLRERLRQPNWNFSRGHHSFAGYSEGVCLLGGIDPTESFSGSEGIGWQFLPGGLEYYGFQQFPSWADAWQLDTVVRDELDRISALELKGLRNVGEAIKAAQQVGIDIPWMETARQNEELSQPLEVLLGTAAPREPDKRGSGSKASVSNRKKAEQRWENDDNRKIRKDKGLEIFLDLRANRFDRCKSGTGNVKKSKIRDRILEGLEELTGGAEVLPAARTIDGDVNRMLAEFGVNLQDYKD